MILDDAAFPCSSRSIQQGAWGVHAIYVHSMASNTVCLVDTGLSLKRVSAVAGVQASGSGEADRGVQVCGQL